MIILDYGKKFIIKTEYGRNPFAMWPTQWVKRTKAIGIISKGGRYSIGTYAHPDIAFEFASWLSPEFKLYLITEFERLKTNEAYQEKIPQGERLVRLNHSARRQMKVLKDNKNIKDLELLQKQVNEENNLITN